MEIGGERHGKINGAVTGNKNTCSGNNNKREREQKREKKREIREIEETESERKREKREIPVT